jgi:large subunit ribosomal protein L18e
MAGWVVTSLAMDPYQLSFQDKRKIYSGEAQPQALVAQRSAGLLSAGPSGEQPLGFGNSTTERTAGRSQRKAHGGPKGSDPQMTLLFNLYNFIARRSGSDFTKKVARRLCLSNTNRRPYSLSRLAIALKDQDPDTYAVVVSKIVNDERLLNIPPMAVCALKFSESARARILAAGGKIITFDQLALQRPTGDKCILLEGDRKRREAVKHFGPAPGDDNSPTRPKLRAKGRKFEKARGRRKSRLYHV